jgi:hypothetical protein
MHVQCDLPSDEEVRNIKETHLGKSGKSQTEYRAKKITNIDLNYAGVDVMTLGLPS